MSLDHWKHTLDVNLNGTFLFAREFLRQLEKHRQTAGNIVLISSTGKKKEKKREREEFCVC
jgi:NAD(P)-dependent dehydrogenase (short-subunit alcohol dehydrogenase family)